MWKQFFAVMLVVLVGGCTAMEYQQIKQEHKEYMQQGNQKLRQINQDTNREKAEQRDITSLRNKLLVERKEQRRQLTTLDVELEQLRAAIKTKEAATVSQKKQIRKYEAEIAKLQKAIRTLQRDTDMETGKRKREIFDINKAINKLFMLIENL